ncbi:hypothetical protein T484DRAFT_2337517 [Baffinella frigidus]|nr:hypothetical protein T484DRAFT_2337517 [Cryptophyta sp. CCMP2293]
MESMWEWTTGSKKRREKKLAGSAFADVAMAAMKKIKAKKQQSRGKWPMSPVKTALKLSSSIRFKSPLKSRCSERLSLPASDQTAKDNVFSAGNGKAPPAVTATGVALKRTHANANLRGSHRLSLPTSDLTAKENGAVAANATGNGETAMASTATGGALKRTHANANLRGCMKGTRPKDGPKPDPALDPELRELLERVGSAPEKAERARLLSSRNTLAKNTRLSMSLDQKPVDYEPAGGVGGAVAGTQLSRRTAVLTGAATRARSWVPEEEEEEAPPQPEANGFQRVVQEGLSNLLGNEDERALLREALGSEMAASISTFDLKWGGSRAALTKNRPPPPRTTTGT